MRSRTKKALVNLVIILAWVFTLELTFLAGRMTAPRPRPRPAKIWTPAAESVTICPPAEGGGLAIFIEGDRIGIWHPGDAGYPMLKTIHNNPRDPAAWTKPK